MNYKGIFMVCMTCLMTITACKTDQKNNHQSNRELPPGSFGYDLEFLKEYKETIVLQKGNAMVALVPDYQGRVMTSTASGKKGVSFGWLNYDLIKSGETVPHFNNYGGEERLWLGPEGGQFSIFFAPGVSFSFVNWQVPAPIDSEPFELVSHSPEEAVFTKNIQLQNYSYFNFSLKVDRSIKLLMEEDLSHLLHMDIPKNLDWVGYESINTITNTGEQAWSKRNGLLSIWILGQFISSPKNTIIAPFIPGSEDELGPIVNDSYFGKIDKNRLVVRDSVLFFKADGQQRGKIGLSPSRAKNHLASYDPDQKILTLVYFTKPDQHAGYVNSMWELQEKPFDGDAINAYNDGPLDDGSQLGPFYELETSSPAAELKPEKSLTHVSKTIHLTGSTNALEMITKHLFSLTLEEIQNALGK